MYVCDIPVTSIATIDRLCQQDYAVYNLWCAWLLRDKETDFDIVSRKGNARNFERKLCLNFREYGQPFS